MKTPTRRLTYEDDEFGEAEHTPLLASQSSVASSGSESRSCCSLTCIYFALMAINGAIVGALGPSLNAISHDTGLDDAALGRIVFQNRLCKLAGTLIWCAYSSTLSHRGASSSRPHAVFAVLMVVSALSALTIGWARSGTALQLGLLSWGVAYGITDSGITSLTVWRWAKESRRRRIDLALLNAGFTVGALMAPMIIAASLEGTHFSSRYLQTSLFATKNDSAGTPRSDSARWVFSVIAAGMALLPSFRSNPLSALASMGGEAGALSDTPRHAHRSLRSGCAYCGSYVRSLPRPHASPLGARCIRDAFE